MQVFSACGSDDGRHVRDVNAPLVLKSI